MNGNGTIQMPPQASTIAGDVDALYYFIFWGCAFFFVLIVGLSLFFILRYRRGPHRRMRPRAYHNTPLELTWTIIPTILVMVVFVWGFKGFMHMSVAPANSIEYPPLDVRNFAVFVTARIAKIRDPSWRSFTLLVFTSAEN